MPMFPFGLDQPFALLLLLSLVPVLYLARMTAQARPRDRLRIGTSAIIRTVIIACISLALAGLHWISLSGPLNVVYLIDESASVTEPAREAAYSYVRQAIGASTENDRIGVVLFGEKAVVDRAVASGTEWQPFGDHPAGVATDIAEAIRVGVALFPEGGARRLVLLSDGVETLGEAREVAARTEQGGVQLSVVPLGGASQNEVAVQRVSSPQSVPRGQQYQARVLLKSTNERNATVRMYDGDRLVGTQDIALDAGQTVVDFSLTAEDEGFRVLRAEVTSADDRYSENNVASSYTVVRAPPSVLIVASTTEDSEPLRLALEAGNIDAQVTTPDGVPTNLEALSEYDTIALANVSADSLGVEREELLKAYVRDMGHGLVMLGGEVSFGAGGYLRSPLEEALPVTMDVRSSEQRASIAMTFLLDKSGSMGRCHCGGNQQFDPSMRTEFGPSKVEIAKQAIARATALLNSSDKVSVVGFDSQPHSVLDLQPVGDLGASGLNAALAPLQAGGGPTNLYTGLQAAVGQLRGAGEQLKHIILISDGWTQQADFTPFLRELAERGVTLSTVGAGEGPGELLQKLAEEGGGKYYTATNVYDLPEVLLKETVRLAGHYYVEETFEPVKNSDSPILEDVGGPLPPLHGYNATTLRPTADLILKSPSGDPILATWQYGLGRAAVWTSDVKGRWATDWLLWPEFGRFAGQLLTWTVPQSGASGLQMAYTLAPAADGRTQDASITVESFDSKGVPRTGLRTVIRVNRGEPLTAPQDAPGVYATGAKRLAEGVYPVEIEQRDPQTGDIVARDTTGIIVPYASEFELSDDAADAGQQLLSELAQLGGGKVLSPDDPAASLVHDISGQPVRVPLWPHLLLVAILLFPIDVAVRRLTFSWRDIFSRQSGGKDGT
ncbi:MAG TPA: VWA domain-containing protein [Chloroflexia bacterium]|nr:VWA domain-containing protein [Chloroflexia bacterium]